MDCKNVNEVHSTVWEVYSETVLSTIEQMFKDEDVRGFATLVPGLVQYQQANLLVSLFYQDFMDNEYSFEYLMAFYKIDELRECFRCLNIDLELLFESVGIDITPLERNPCTIGIESIIVETSFQIEIPNCLTEVVIPDTGEHVNISELLLLNDLCNILIN